MSDIADTTNESMDTPMTLLVQGLLVQGVRGTPEDYEGEAQEGTGQEEVLYLKEVKIYSGGEKVAEMAHLALNRSAIAGISAGRVTLLGA